MSSNQRASGGRMETKKGGSDRILEILNMGDHTHNVASHVAFTEPLFRATPSEVMFETFQPLKQYEHTLTFRNSDSVGRKIRVIPPRDRVFEVSEPQYKGNSNNAKIAPGMEVSYTVYFRPEEAIDYYYELEFVTERERFFVPIHGLGPCPQLQLPDIVDFGDSPACFTSERTFLVRNVGNKAARVYLSTESPFQCTPSTTNLEPQEAVQVQVSFSPTDLGEHDGELLVECDGAEPQVVQLVGLVVDVDVTTDKSVILCDATYVTLGTQKTFSIRNNSDVLVKFSLKNNATRQEDEDKQRDELARLEEQEAKERSQLEHTGLGLADESEDDDDLGMGLALAAHEKKYSRLRKQIMEDKQLFSHDIFAVEPLEGDIYPGGEVEFLVTFTPAIAVEYINSVYCDISGRALRTPVHLKGRGIGPRVCFSYAGLNLDDVFMNTAYEYKAELENRGEIEARFQLNPSATQYGQFFSFEPETGVLRVGEKREINITVMSNTAGEFGEDFAWTIQGSPNDLKIRFQGHFIGPDVTFDADMLDFDHVSYGFVNSKIFRLCNASPIPAAWKLQLDEDGKLLDREFDIVPSSGTILPHGKTKVQVDFVSRNLRGYSLNMHLGIEGVGETVKTLPISAICEAPRVSFSPPKLDFKETFIRHPTVLELELQNNSDLPARYEVLDQDDMQMQTATIVPDQTRGVIAPYQSVTMEVTITSFRLGMTSLPMNIAINGYDSLMVVDVQAQVLGPRVTVSQPVLDFKNCKVFEEVKKDITLTNPTPIPAHFEIGPLRGTAFKLSMMEGVIPPESDLVLNVSATTDDANAFKEDVKITVAEGDEVGFNLKCKGVGTTIQCDEELDAIRFGDVYTHRNCERVIVLHNRSKKPQDVEWILEKLKDKKGEVKPNVFKMEPLKAKMNPKSSQEFTLTGTKPKPGEVEEMIECQATAGKNKLTVYTMNVSAIFNNPLLEFTTRSMQFHYTGRVDPNAKPSPTDVLANDVTITNVSPLTLDVVIKCPDDFTTDVTKIKLAPNESKEIKVSFIVAGSEEKRESKEVKQNLMFTYANHPQKDKIDLKGVVVFPNLNVEYTSVDFGAVLNDTESRSYLTITNTSAVPVKCRWYFEEPDAAPGKNAIPINQVFDIVPIRSSLDVGESEQIEFVFFGHQGRSAKAQAVCIVEDGPEYKVRLRGEASGIDYKFDKNELDFGSLQYEYAAERDFTVQNTGKVEFSFNIVTDGVKPPRTCVVQPLSGKIAPGGKQRVMVKVTPGMPEEMDSEFLEVQIAHLEPEIIKVTGTGTFPNGWTTLPRVPDEAYSEFRALVDETSEDFPTPVLVEAECDRRVFCKHLEEIANPTETKRSRSTPGSAKTATAPRDGPKLPDYYLSKFVCDFGNVIKGVSAKKKFTIRNVGFSSLTIDLDKKIFQPENIFFNPDKIKSLSGAPSNEDFDIEVEMQTESRDVGQLELELPLVVKSGPAIALVFRANILIPDVKVSASSINFGLTNVGRLRTEAVQLTNEMVVPIEWSMTDKASRSPFSMEPSRGRLKPGDACNVVITFRPGSQEDFVSKLMVKVSHNPKPHYIVCKGKGAELNIDLEPTFADFFPVLPHSSSSTIELTVTNTSLVPVEVYSLDFDSAWLEEEDVLRLQEGYERNELLNAPRDIGEPLPNELVQFHATLMAEKAAREAPPAEEETEAEEEAAPEEAAGEATEEPEEVEPPPARMVILAGPPLSGKTSIADECKHQLGFTQLSLDDAVETLIKDVESEAGEALRAHLEYQTAAMLADADGDVERPASRGSNRSAKSGKSQKTNKSAKSGKSRPPSAAASAKSGAEEEEEEPSGPGEEAPAAEPVELIDPPVPVKPLTAELITQVVSEYVARLLTTMDPRSFVVDTLHSEYLPNVVDAESGEEAVPCQKDWSVFSQALRDTGASLRFCFLRVLPEEVLRRKAEMDRQFHQGSDAQLKAAEPKHLTEDQYDQLKDDQKAAFNESVRAFKAERRAHANRAQEWEAKWAARDLTAETSTFEEMRTKIEELFADYEVPDKPEPPTEEVPEPTDSEAGPVEKTWEEMDKKERVALRLREATQLLGELQERSEAMEDGDDKTAAAEGLQSIVDQTNELLSEEGPGITTRGLEALLNSAQVATIPEIPVPVPELPDSTVDEPEVEESAADGEVPLAEQVEPTPVVEPASVDATVAKLDDALLTFLGADGTELISMLHGQKTVMDLLLDMRILGNVIWEPPPPPEPLPIPEPQHLQIYRKPAPAQPRAAVRNFRIEKVVEEKEVDPDADPVDEDPDQEEKPEEPKEPEYRLWLQEGETRKILVHFASEDVGSFSQALAFAIVGKGKEYVTNFKGQCAYPQISSDPRNVFYKKVRLRQPSQIIDRQFVMSENVFDFGPILINKDFEGCREKKGDVNNVAKFRITNNGLFDAIVTFYFKNQSESTPDSEAVFLIDQRQLTLPKDETTDVSVWAFPKNLHTDEEGVESELKIDDELVCCIKNNPEPVSFPISCVGDKPRVAVDLEAIEFDPLRVGNEVTKELTMTNQSLLPVKWKFENLEQLYELQCFSISKTEGIIAPKDNEKVKVTFDPKEPGEYNTEIKLVISDIDDLCNDIPELPLAVTAESYNITYKIELPDGEDEGGNKLDYGLVKVFEQQSKDIVIHNEGKFDIKYVFAMRKRRFAGQPIDQIFTFPEPEEELEEGEESKLKKGEGVISAEEGSKTVSLLFNTDKEMQLVDNTDIRIKILDAMSEEFITAVPLPISVEAVFSKYRVVPSAINFGSIVYGDNKEKFFDIQNKGQFDFTFELFDFGEGRDEGNPKDPDKPGTLELANGAFKITPDTGSVPAGGQMSVQINFETSDAQLFLGKMGLFISECDPAEVTKDGVLYEIVGESCIPCINTSKWTSIFEEQAVVSNIDFGDVQSNLYSEEQRIFSYGPVLVGRMNEQRFRMTNPNRVPCDVNFTVTTEPPKNAGKTPAPDGTGEEFQIIDPVEGKVHIGPHESQFVTVRYQPAGMQRSYGKFHAEVELGNETLDFDLFGEGTLPSINVEATKEFTEDGCPLINFSKLRVGRSHTEQVVIRNDSILAATVRVDASSLPRDFTFDGVGLPITLDPRMSRTLTMKFNPSEPAEHDFKIRFIVSNNDFEENVVAVQGHGYTEDAYVDGLGGEEENLVDFGSYVIGSNNRPSKKFKVKNKSDTPHVFEFPMHPEMEFHPQKMHIMPHTEMEVTVEFKCDEEKQYEKEALSYSSEKIEYPDGVEMLVWDSDMVIPLEEGEELPDGEEPRKVEEPGVTIVPDTRDEKTIVVDAAADWIHYTCDCDKIELRPTSMYQTRLYKFSMTNEALVEMIYKWDWQNSSGASVSGGSFSITPPAGKMATKGTQEFVVRYSPLEVEDAELFLVSNIKNLKEGEQQKRIPVRSQSIRPWCHFEVEPNDYITADRREPGPGTIEPDPSFGMIDQSTHVLEFKSLGTSIRNTRRFYVTNPTNIAYDFEWVCGDGRVGGSFKCKTLKGRIVGGKKYEMVFEFTPEQTHTEESFWRFSIPEKNVEVFFLLVGCTTDPAVYFETPHFKFGELLVGGRGSHQIHLKNDEHIPFSFAFDKESWEPGGQKSALQVEPLRGVVPPGGDVGIHVTLAPDVETDYNYNLVCNVRNKPTPLGLNIKGQGYAIHDTVQLVDADGRTLALSSEVANQIHFGSIQTMDKREKTVQLINSGSYNFDYKWVTESRNPFVQIIPDQGTVRAHEKESVTLVYHPIYEGMLQGFKAQMKIQHGKTYTMLLSGMANKPRIVFSFVDYSFGACFLHKRGMKEHEAVLTISNNDSQDHSVDLEFENKPYLEVASNPMVLQPGDFAQIPIKFLPREVTLYKEVLEFEINNLEKVAVTITGEGCPAKLELVDQGESRVDFGAVRVDQEVSKRVRIINRSKIDLDYSLEESANVLATNAVSMGRSATGTLKPRGVGFVDLRFRPSSRIRHFTEQVSVQYAGLSHPLFTVSGGGHGIELKMDTDTLIFGDTVVGSKVTRRLGLENTGDIGVGYKWDVYRFAPYRGYFSISPTEGFLAPNQSVMFLVEFAPTRLERDIRVENIQLSVDGSEPMLLTLSGSGIEAEPDGESFSFKAPVRQKDTKKIPIKNDSGFHWRVRPVIDNEFWTGAEIAEVPKGTTFEYELTYHPLTMTNPEDEANAKHTGSIFFPLPDGTAHVYKLEGEADAPEAEKGSPITMTVPSKKVHTVRVPVTNWLSTAQKFKVNLEITGTAEADDKLVLRGLDTMDVPGGKVKDYKMSYQPFKTGATSAKVTFTNEDTGEYLYYDVQLTAGEAGTPPDIKLEGVCRQLINHSIPVENPFNQEVTLQVQLGACSAWDITHPATITVAPQKEELLPLRLRPLLAGDNDVEVKLSCAELGEYVYKLKLSATAAGPEGGMHFSTDLGGLQPQKFRFKSYRKAPTSYTCSVEDEDFEGDAKVDAPAAEGDDGVEVELNVTFEPSKLGTTHATMLLKSAEGGDYTVNLHGDCVPPKPKGPFEVKGSFNLPFKNVFPDEKKFSFTVDNPCFTVGPAKKQLHEEVMAGKKDSALAISYAAQEGYSAAGKLVASSPGAPNWVFYLNGS